MGMGKGEIRVQNRGLNWIKVLSQSLLSQVATSIQVRETGSLGIRAWDRTKSLGSSIEARKGGPVTLLLQTRVSNEYLLARTHCNMPLCCSESVREEVTHSAECSTSMHKALGSQSHINHVSGSSCL